MTPADLKSARQKLGLTQAGLARLLRLKDARPVREWELGENDIAGPAVVLIELLVDLPAARRAVGL